MVDLTNPPGCSGLDSEGENPVALFEALRREIQAGIKSGEAEPLDMDAIERCARARFDAVS